MAGATTAHRGYNELRIFIELLLGVVMEANVS